jgi:hypothetical protein
MNHIIIVVAFTTVDGVVEDPDGSGGTANGGWAFRHGPEAVAGDKFELGRAAWRRRAAVSPASRSVTPGGRAAAARPPAARQ